MSEKPTEYECEHIAFFADADGPKFMVKVKGADRHWYLKLKTAHVRLVAADSTTFMCDHLADLQKPID